MNTKDKDLQEKMQELYPRYFFIGENDEGGVMMGMQDAKFLTIAFLNYIDGKSERAYPFVETALNYLTENATMKQVEAVRDTLNEIMTERMSKRVQGQKPS